MTYIDKMDIEETERIREEEAVAQEMMYDEVRESVAEFAALFPKSFVNNRGELILCPKTNLYFKVDNIGSVKELRCKIIEWCSRDACKSTPFYHTKRNEEYQGMVRDRINEFLGVDFSKGDWLLIYTYLGNNINRPLCESFVDSDYDLKIIEKHEEEKYGKV